MIRENTDGKCLIPKAIAMNRFLLMLCAFCFVPVQGLAAEKPRVIVTSDGEIDDQCSMIRFMLYTNECDVEGIISSSSQYHSHGHNWAGDDWIDPDLERIIEEVRGGTATFEGIYKSKKRVADESKITGIIDSQKDVGGWPELKSTPAPTDTDHDGMPDEWERKHEFDPNDAADGSKDSDGDGYTNLEDYMNEIRSTGSLAD